jgi:hypothetical protein
LKTKANSEEFLDNKKITACESNISCKQWVSLINLDEGLFSMLSLRAETAE